MGLFDLIKGEFIEVIEYDSNDKNIILYKYPMESKQQIKKGAQLIVNPSQVAIFVYEGEIADIYTSGKYTLDTDTMPLLTSLENFKYFGDSPFKTDIYFINTSQYLNQKWGTSKPITMRDHDFGIVRVRSYGSYSFTISDPSEFLTSVLGAGSTVTLDSISTQLKSIIVSTFSDILVTSKVPAIDLPMKYDEFNSQITQSLAPKFEKLALNITGFIIENISLPKEVEETIDKRSSMGILGDLNTYTQYQMADSIKDLAQNEGGIAGLGASLSVGAQMGKSIGNAFSQPQTQQTVSKPMISCSKCNAQVEKDSKFCPNCGNSLINVCISCEKPIDANAKFCPNCGANQSSKKTCSCGNELNENDKFCTKCGTPS